MANSKQTGGVSRGTPMGAYPHGAPVQNAQQPQGKRGKKKELDARCKAEANRARKTMAARQQRAIENAEYRAKLAAITQSRGGMDNTLYKLAEDTKPRKERDYFYVARKSVCFLMFLVMLVSIALFALSYLKLEIIPKEYISLFIVTEASAAETEEDDTEETGIQSASYASEGEDAEEETAEEEGAESSKILESHMVTDPIFGFIKNISGKFTTPISLGDSPLYDDMLAKSEIGMIDKVGAIVLAYFPVALIIYLITALIMTVKAFLGMFGRRIYKKFGLGAFVAIVCAGITALGGLAYVTELNATMNYGSIVDILIGSFTGVSGFIGGYGLLALIALPLVTFILSIFAKKKVPYSIFDN